jgi:hypothetical protein
MASHMNPLKSSRKQFLPVIFEPFQSTVKDASFPNISEANILLKAKMEKITNQSHKHKSRKVEILMETSDVKISPNWAGV